MVHLSKKKKKVFKGFCTNFGKVNNTRNYNKTMAKRIESEENKGKRYQFENGIEQFFLCVYVPIGAKLSPPICLSSVMY